MDQAVQADQVDLGDLVAMARYLAQTHLQPLILSQEAVEVTEDQQLQALRQWAREPVLAVLSCLAEQVCRL